MKAWYQSKTIWSGLAMIALAVQQGLPVIQEYVQPEAYAYLLFFFGVLKIALRFISDEAIKREE